MSATWIKGRHGVPSLRIVIRGRRARRDEVVEHEVEPQPVAHPARGREAEARDREGLVRQLGQVRSAEQLRGREPSGLDRLADQLLEAGLDDRAAPVVDLGVLGLVDIDPEDVEPNRESVAAQTVPT